MTIAILRGFDFLAGDIGDQLRLCNPLISFGDSEAAPIFLARDLQKAKMEPAGLHPSTLMKSPRSPPLSRGSHGEFVKASASCPTFRTS